MIAELPNELQTGGGAQAFCTRIDELLGKFCSANTPRGFDFDRLGQMGAEQLHDFRRGSCSKPGRGFYEIDRILCTNGAQLLNFFGREQIRFQNDFDAFIFEVRHPGHAVDVIAHIVPLSAFHCTDVNDSI